MSEFDVCFKPLIKSLIETFLASSSICQRNSVYFPFSDSTFRTLSKSETLQTIYYTILKYTFFEWHESLFHTFTCLVLFSNVFVSIRWLNLVPAPWWKKVDLDLLTPMRLINEPDFFATLNLKVKPKTPKISWCQSWRKKLYVFQLIHCQCHWIEEAATERERRCDLAFWTPIIQKVVKEVEGNLLHSSLTTPEESTDWKKEW